MENSSSVARTGEILAGYFDAFASFLNPSLTGAVERLARLLVSARERGATIYIAGNGGSAAIASHWVNDLGKATKRSGQRPMRVMSLSDNISWLTALANDEGYERIFAGQLENFGESGDVLIVISSSGNSANLIEAVKLARSRGMTTVGMLGFDGGLLKDKVNECLWLPTAKGSYGLVESAHTLLCHVLTDCLAKGAVGSGEGQEFKKAGAL